MDDEELWKDPNVGTAKRVAHYLATEVGAGHVFNRSDLREVVPDSKQVDRRMRDLRKVGWRIRNHKDMPPLKPSQMFLETVGDRVWEDGYRWPSAGLSPGMRKMVLTRDGRQCRLCGIDFGAEFPDQPGIVARATIAQRGYSLNYPNSTPSHR